jgi:hypothetical protein
MKTNNLHTHLLLILQVIGDLCHVTWPLDFVSSVVTTARSIRKDERFQPYFHLCTKQTIVFSRQ